MQSIKQLMVLTKRILKQNLTNVDTVITVILMPLFMLMFFVYVLGGNIAMNGVNASTGEYLKYALPGFLLVAMAMGSAYTAVRINLDKTKGFLKRLHSLPIKRWVILGSHVLASVIFMIISESVVLVAGFVMGYRPDLSVENFALFVLVSPLFAFTITLIAIPFSLKASSIESAGGFSYIILMLLFVSSAFIPMDGMIKPVRWFAENQPMTALVGITRDLLNNNFSITSSNSLQSLVWLVGLIILFSYLSYRRYKMFSVKL